MACTDMLRHLELRSDAEIRDALSGNICRCTGYEHIVNAVREAVQKRGPLAGDPLA
jgi:carbon-monoxide dehydrogenase small subunit